MQQSMLAGASVLTASSVKANTSTKNNAATFHLNYAIHDGMFEENAGKDFLDQIRFAYDNGFRAIEDNGMMDRTVDEQKKIGDLLAKLNMQMGAFVLMQRGMKLAICKLVIIRVVMNRAPAK